MTEQSLDINPKPAVPQWTPDSFIVEEDSEESTSFVDESPIVAPIQPQPGEINLGFLNRATRRMIMKKYGLKMMQEESEPLTSKDRRKARKKRLGR